MSLQSSLLSQIPKKIIGDYLVHNTSIYRVADSMAVDALWHSTNNSLVPWIIGNRDSKYFIRQLFASFANTHRFSSTQTMSSIDAFLSYILSGAFGNIDAFSDKNCRVRCYKRTMLSASRNGGVYKEITFFNETINQKYDYLNKIATRSPLNTRTTHYKGKIDTNYAIKHAITDIKELRNLEKSTPFLEVAVGKIVSDDLNIDIDSYFDSFSFVPTKARNGVLTFNGTLKSGQPISLTVFMPNQERMQIMDLLPLSIAQGLLAVFPFSRSEVSLLKALYKRFAFSIRNEADSREKILKAFDIDINRMSHENISKAVESNSLPLTIPAPLPGLVGKRVMVSTRIPAKTPTALSDEIIEKEAEFASRLLEKGLVISDLRMRNIRIDKNNLSLDRFNISPISENERKGFSEFAAIRLGTDSSRHEELASKILGVKKHSVKSSCRPIDKRPLFKKHAGPYLALSEMFNSLALESKIAGMDNDTVFKPFAKHVSKFTGLDETLATQAINKSILMLD